MKLTNKVEIIDKPEAERRAKEGQLEETFRLDLPHESFVVIKFFREGYLTDLARALSSDVVAASSTPETDKQVILYRYSQQPSSS